MSKKKIIFRADASSEIGLGHVIRTLALAEMLNDYFECIFATREFIPAINNNILDVCTSIISLPKNEEHFNFFLAQLNGDEIVVLDNYFFNVDYQNDIKKKGCKLVCIDDMADRHFVADLIINHSPCVNSSDYKALPYTQFVLGPKYALLRPLFLERAEKQRIVSKVDNVLICFGGSDPMNLTYDTLQVIKTYKKFNRIIVIIGAAYQNLDKLSKLIEYDDRIELKHSLNQKQLVQTMLETDIAIAPTSGILFELMAVGVPVITGYYAKNQKEASINLGSLKAVYSLGNLSDNFKNKLVKQLNVISVESMQEVVINQKKTVKNSKNSYIKAFRNLI